MNGWSNTDKGGYSKFLDDTKITIFKNKKTKKWGYAFFEQNCEPMWGKEKFKMAIDVLNFLEEGDIPEGTRYFELVCGDCDGSTLILCEEDTEQGVWTPLTDQECQHCSACNFSDIYLR